MAFARRPGSRLSTLDRRGSSLSLHRRGSTLGGKRTDDPRPVRDKRYQKRMQERLYNFLDSHSYPFHVTEQMLQSPSSKQFLQVTQFLFQQVDPGIRLGGDRWQDDVVRYLQRFGYPGRLSPSSLRSVGSSHAWPPVLAALCWLVELVEYQERVEQLEADGADVDLDLDSEAAAAAQEGSQTSAALARQAAQNAGSAEDREFFRCVSDAYANYLGGRGQSDDFQSEMRKIFEEQRSESTSMIERYRQENDKLREEVVRLKEAGSLVEERREALQQKHLEVENIENELTSLDKRAQEVEQEMSQMAHQVEALRKETARHRREHERLQAQIDSQSISQEDVQRILARQGALEVEHTSLREQATQLDQRDAAAAASNSELRQELQHLASAWNDRARRLEIVPESARYAFNVDLSVHFQWHTLDAHVDRDDMEDTTDLSQVRRQVMPVPTPFIAQALAQLSAYLQNQAASRSAPLSRAQQEVDEALAAQRQLTSSTEQLRKQLENRKRQCDEARRHYDDRLQVQIDEIETVEEEMQQLQMSQSDERSKTQADLEILTRRARAVREDHARDLRALKESVANAMSLVSDHRVRVSGALDSLCKLHKNSLVSQY